MIRSAFTLVEMLVATMVFIIGFVAVYSLFIAGMNYRHESDRLTNTALAATSLISTWRLQMQDQWGPVTDFIGDGDPTNGDEAATAPEDIEFYPYPDKPSIRYRIWDATDAAGLKTDTESSSTVRLELLLIDMGDAAENPTLEELLTRHRVMPGINDDFLNGTYPDTLEDPAAYNAITSPVEKAIYILVRRKILARHEAIILRR